MSMVSLKKWLRLRTTAPSAARKHLPDDPVVVLRREPLAPYPADAQRAPEGAGRAAADAEDLLLGGRRTRRPIEDQDRADSRLLLGQAPRRLEQAAGPAPDVFELGLFEADRVDGEPLAHVVEKNRVGAPAALGGRGFQDRMGALELRLVGDEVVEAPVLGPQEMEPFEVGVRDAPAPLLVDPEAVREDFAQRAFRVEEQRTLKVRACEPILERRLRLLAEPERVSGSLPRSFRRRGRPWPAWRRAE